VTRNGIHSSLPFPFFSTVPTIVHTQAVSKILVRTYDLRFTSHSLYTFPTLMYIVIVNIISQNNQSFMSLYGYIYFMWHHLHSTFYTTVRCSRYQDLQQCCSIILEILLLCVLYLLIVVSLPDYER